MIDFFGVVLVFQYGFEFLSVLFIPCFGYADQMAFYGIVDGAFRHTLNLASAAWVWYFIAHDLVSLGSVCVGPSTNNIAEFQEVIGFFY